MSIEKDKNGTWKVRYSKQRLDGTRIKTTKRGFKTKREASEWEYNHTNTNTLELPLKTFYGIYIADKTPELKVRTINLKKDIYRRFIAPYFENRILYDIKPNEISEWQSKILEKGYTSSYQRTIVKEFRAVYTHAMNYYDLPESENPFKKVKLIGKYGKTNTMNFWTEDEFRTFIGVMEYADKYHLLFSLLFYTGMRVGEALDLTPNDIDLDNKTITVNKTFWRRNRITSSTSPKTEASNRIIDIPAFLADELRAYLNRFYGGLENDERLFNIGHEAVQNKIKRTAEKAGVKRIRVHDLRHSHAAYLIYKGVDPLILQERLGHTDIKMTLGTYGHIYPSRQKAIMKIIEEDYHNNNF